MTDFIKPTPEAFQFMVRYSDIAKVKVSTTSLHPTFCKPHCHDPNAD